MLRLLFVPRFNKLGASSRYRIYQFLPLLRQQGHKVRCIRLWEADSTLKKSWHLTQLLAFTKWADVVYIQKWFLNRHVFNMLQQINANIIVDYDDAIYTAQTHAKLLGQPIERAGIPHFTHMLRQCRRVVVCNEELANYARQFTQAVSILPTVVDTKIYRPLPAEGPQITLGWVGSASTLPYLTILESVFANLQDSFGEKIRLMVVCDKPYTSQSGLQIINVNWKLEKEIETIQQFDIGLMPLSDDTWSRGKCGFKAIQCMATAVPVVVSAVGMNKTLIDHGVNGFLANSEKEWETILSRLIIDKNLRKKIGQQGRQTIQDAYSLDFAFPRLLHILNDSQNE